MKRQLGYMVHTLHCRSVCLCMHAQRKVIKCQVIYYVYHTTDVMLNGSLPPHNGAPKLCGQKKWPPLQRVTLNNQLLTTENQHVMKCHLGARLRKDPWNDWCDGKWIWDLELGVLDREVGGACGVHGGGERCAQGSSGETRGKEAIGETQT